MIALRNVTRLYREDISQHKLVSAEDFEADQIIARFRAGEILREPNYLTVQVSETEHILLEPSILEFINHSCDPNVFFDTESMLLVSLRRVQKGEELTFFYPSTEWDMAASFPCNCGGENCLGVIQGARFLSCETLSRFRLTRHISRLLAARANEGGKEGGLVPGTQSRPRSRRF